MGLEIGKIYLLQTKWRTSWIKVYEDDPSKESIKYITSVKVTDIKDIDVSSTDKFMTKIYYFASTKMLLCTEENLHKILNMTLSQNDRLNCYLDNKTHQEEIDGDFNGNIEEWMRYYNIKYMWVENCNKIVEKVRKSKIGEYINLANISNLSTDGDWRKSQLSRDVIIDDPETLLIPHDKVLSYGGKYEKLYPYVYGVSTDSSEFKMVKRDLMISDLFS